MEGTVTNLLGVVQNAQQVRAARKIQPHQMTDEMGSLDGFVGLLRTSMMARLEDADDSAFELLPSHGRSITVLNFKAKGENVAEEGKGKASHLFAGTPIKHRYSSPSRLQPVVELVKEA